MNETQLLMELKKFKATHQQEYGINTGSHALHGKTPATAPQSINAGYNSCSFGKPAYFDNSGNPETYFSIELRGRDGHERIGRQGMDDRAGLVC